MKRTGFTMMELIIVIVIGGILAAVMIPRLERDPTREAANQIVRHIQYAQHLAMVDDVYLATDNTWFTNRWRITFNSANYTVSSTHGTGTVATNQGSQELINGTAAGDLSEYSVTLSLKDGCSGKSAIAFDNFGSPHLSLSTITETTWANACTIEITGNGKTATVSIQPETGYVHLDSVI